ncbi:thioether cross-link-forming SCIFF peptide maturase [Pelotomaculum propionicicum]|uniref:thioether cross-link-forming SCIFF peptide maturase n=1 Tax=Pelotomaculum propionicicum TaxID=258475 RepID=UPI003B81A338
MLHKFEFDGSRVVLDVHSGTVHVVDELVWDLLEDYRQIPGESLVKKYCQKYDIKDIEEALAEIKGLEKKGQLFSGDPCRDLYSPPVGFEVKSLCLHLAHSCNLRCRYCFAGQGRFGGDDELMPADTGKRALDFLIARSGSRRRLEVDFFGGEPLLNLSVLQELVDYGRERGHKSGKDFKFTLTTNAVLLDEKVTQYLNEQNISVVLSLDGRREVHDAMRPKPGGAGSYDIVMDRIKSFVNSRGGENYIIRGTYTRRNTDFCADVLHIADMGFEHLSVEPVVAPEEAEYSIRGEDLPCLFSQYEALTRELLRRRRNGNPFDFFHFNIDLDGGPCLPKRLTGCGAGHEYMAVAPNGDIYPCHQFVGREGFLLGNVYEQKINGALVSQFRTAHVYNKETCAGCWARFYCSGGCHANAEMSNGTILEPYSLGCELAKKRLECAIYLKVMEAGA